MFSFLQFVWSSPHILNSDLDIPKYSWQSIIWEDNWQFELRKYFVQIQEPPKKSFLRLWRLDVACVAYVAECMCGATLSLETVASACGVPRSLLRLCKWRATLSSKKCLCCSQLASWWHWPESWVRQARLSTPLSSVANAQVWRACRCLSCLWLTSTFEPGKAEDIKMSPRTITQHSLSHYYQGSIGF